MEKKIAEEILKKPPAERTSSDIEFLVKSLQKVKFFSQLSEEVQIECFKVMTLEVYLEGDYICRKGEPGDCMYVILSGSVRVLSVEVSKAQLETDLQGEIATIGPGNAFGQMALLNDTVRNATVQCLERTISAILFRQDYRLIKSIQEQKLNQRIKFLKELPAFVNWTRISLQKLGLTMDEIAVGKGQLLFKQGDKAQEVYLVKQGQLKITQVYDMAVQKPSEFFSTPEYLRTFSLKKNCRVKKNLQIAIKETGEMIGFEQIIDNTKLRKFTCTTLTDCVLYLVGEKDFVKKVQHPRTKLIVETHSKISSSLQKKRIQILKQVEKYKEQISRSPNRRVFIRNTPQPQRQKVFTPQQKTMENIPVILSSILTSSRPSTSCHSRTRIRHPRTDFNFFPTEISKNLASSSSEFNKGFGKFDNSKRLSGRSFNKRLSGNLLV